MSTAASGSSPGTHAGPAAGPTGLGVGTVLSRGRVRGPLRLIGPAFIAAIAYVDPGNFATNVSAGARYGYLLLWVIVAANLMAVVVQYLASKAGIVTGRSLPELCRDRYTRPVRWGLWVQAEVVAIATDLAEFVGAAIALQLLFGVAPLVSGVITAGIALALLGVQTRGARSFEIAISVFLGLIVVAFGLCLSLVDVDRGELVAGLRPRLVDPGSVLLAVGIIGATVMPHVVYLHSALVPGRIGTRDDGEVRTLLRFTRLDVGLAMLVAGAVNLTMLIVAAAAVGATGVEVSSLTEARDALAAGIGPGVGTLFAIALLASGLSSSSVGTMAGQVVMQGFIRRRVPLLVRRLVTITPAMVVLAVGVEPTAVLVLSQVVLSLGIPFALIPLIHMTSSRSVMGDLVNGRMLTGVAVAVAALVVAMNATLLVVTATAG